MRSTNTKKVLFLLATFVAALCLADTEKVVPQPRKRLGRTDAAVEVGLPGSKSVIGEIQTLEAQYTNALMQCIIAEYNASTRKLDDDAKFRAPIQIHLKIETKSSAVELVAITGEVNIRRRALLGEAVSTAAKKVICPPELYQKGIESFKYAFSMSLRPN